MEEKEKDLASGLNKVKMTVFDYIEDFDNPQLEFPEWVAQMTEAVNDYNTEYGTIYSPANVISRYQWSKDYDKWNGL